MLTVNLEDFQGRLLELIDQAASGEPFIIAKADQPLVKVVPCEKGNASKRLGFMRGQGVVGADIDIKSIAREEIIALFEGRDETAS
jgi:antitoxin (DNA-binding transcriptional repressor) of toxin-antitoxin stability system